MTPKKIRERAALLLLYDPAIFKIEDAERPDFVLHLRPFPPFGVEVTDLYDSEVAARIDRIPGYAIQLTRGASFRHKADAETLTVDDLVFTSPDGKRKTPGRAVIFMPPPFAEYVARLRDTIVDKAEKAKAYRADLRHVNLVIVDRTNRLLFVKPELLHDLLLNEEVRAAVAGTPFREIYLISTVDPKRRVYIPLRMLLLVSFLFLFPGALEAYAPSHPLPVKDELLHCLHSYFQIANIDSCLLEGPSGCELVFGNASVRWDENGGLVVHDYADTEHGGVRTTSAPLDGPWCTPEFEEAFSQYRRNNCLSVTGAFDVRSPAV